MPIGSPRNIPQPKLQGEKHPAAKLTAEQVKEIRKRYEIEDTSIRKLATEYEVSFSTIYELVNHITWKHIRHEG